MLYPPHTLTLTKSELMNEMTTGGNCRAWSENVYTKKGFHNHSVGKITSADDSRTQKTCLNEFFIIDLRTLGLIL